MNKQKTGIFSGSFNPIHIGHLALANYLCEYEGLDEIWFMVSPQNPLKAQEKLWNDELRLELVKLSISDYPRFQASDFEFHLPRPSYSVYTLEKLREALGFSDKDGSSPIFSAYSREIQRLAGFLTMLSTLPVCLP